MRTIVTNVYRYHELSNEAKDVARKIFINNGKTKEGMKSIVEEYLSKRMPTCHIYKTTILSPRINYNFSSKKDILANDKKIGQIIVDIYVSLQELINIADVSSLLKDNTIEIIKHTNGDLTTFLKLENTSCNFIETRYKFEDDINKEIENALATFCSILYTEIVKLKEEYVCSVCEEYVVETCEKSNLEFLETGVLYRG